MVWSVLLGGLALALAGPTVAGPSADEVPVFAVTTYVGGHRFATLAVGYSTYAVVVDGWAWARTFQSDLGELDLTVNQSDDPQQGGRSFGLRFGSGPVTYSSTIAATTSATLVTTSDAKRSRRD